MNKKFKNQKIECFNKDEEIFKQLIKNSFDMIVLLDSNGIQNYVSESSERIIGYKPEELIGISIIEEMIHPENQEVVIAGFHDIIENSANGGTQYRHRHKSGGWVYLEAFGTNQINNPLIKSVILNVRDISDRKKVEQALKESEGRLTELNATKDLFFSIIGHDLKGPFNSILGFSNLLVNQIHEKDYEGIEKYAAIIQDSSKLSMDLISNLLEWSRSQSGRIVFNPEYIELVAVINEVIILLKNSAQQKSIRLSAKLPHSIGIKADKAMLSTVLRNLISNGIKFTHSGGEIVISVENKLKYLIISVSDNGVGLKKADMDKLFRIEHSHSTLGTNKEKGTGLGLLLCKEFIEMHGCEIWADCNQEKGCTFNFTMPLS